MNYYIINIAAFAETDKSKIVYLHQSIDKTKYVIVTTETIDELSIRGMVGASIFWESPFGPIRFDFTQPLKKYPYDERKSFQFTTRTRF